MRGVAAAPTLRACAAARMPQMKARPFTHSSRAPISDDQRVADDLDPVARRRLIVAAVAPSSAAAIADDHDRDQRLQQRRGERQHDAAPPGLVVGDQIGRDHRLAVAGAGGVEDAVEERQRRSGPDRAAVGLGGADRPENCDRIRPAWRGSSRRCRPARSARPADAARRTESAPAPRRARRATSKHAGDQLRQRDR